MTGENYKIKLNEDLAKLNDEFIALLNTNSKYYFDSVLESVKFMTDKGMGGVYLTSAHPHDYMMKVFERYNIETKNLFFIDTISCMAGKSPGESGNCVFIENPAALEEVGMWTSMLLERVGSKDKFLIVDSLSTLLIYNTVEMLKKFSQFSITRLRLQGASGLFVSIDMEIDEGFYDTLATLCDNIIKV